VLTIVAETVGAEANVHGAASGVERTKRTWQRRRVTRPTSGVLASSQAGGTLIVELRPTIARWPPRKLSSPDESRTLSR
jgi:hypothetical protein